MRRNEPPCPEDLVCAADICRILKISRRTFQRLRETGKLPPPVVQWNKTSMRWRRTDILAMMGPPLQACEREAALVSAARHITAAAAAAIAAGHHAAAAANSIRRLQINSAPLVDQDAAKARAAEPSRSPPIAAMPPATSSSSPTAAGH